MNENSKTEPTRILIIDDEASFTRMVKLNVQNAGNYLVETLNDSPKAHAVVKEFKPDIILLDVIMPEADGGDVATMLRESIATKDIPIIFISAMVSRNEANKGLYQSGGEFFLAKPVSSDVLIDAINRVLL